MTLEEGRALVQAIECRMSAGTYVNDFIDPGRVKKVYMQAESAFRMRDDGLATEGFASCGQYRRFASFQ